MCALNFRELLAYLRHFDTESLKSLHLVKVYRCVCNLPMSVGGVRLQHLFVFSGDDDINLAGGPSKFVTDVAVDHTGKCSWGGPATFKVSCRMKIDLWPFDQQECQLAFGSFSYGENLLKLNLFKDQSNFASKEFVKCYN